MAKCRPVAKYDVLGTIEVTIPLNVEAGSEPEISTPMIATTKRTGKFNFRLDRLQHWTKGTLHCKRIADQMRHVSYDIHRLCP